MRNNHENGLFYGLFIQNEFRLGSVDWVPADNEALDPDMPTLIFANPAGAVDVLLPESTAARKGLAFLISNVSASAITFKTSADAAFTTAIVLAAGESAWVFCTGSATPELGWRATGTASSA